MDRKETIRLLSLFKSKVNKKFPIKRMIFLVQEQGEAP
jgi:hypothetical protein